MAYLFLVLSQKKRDASDSATPYAQSLILLYKETRMHQSPATDTKYLPTRYVHSRYHSPVEWQSGVSSALSSSPSNPTYESR